MTTKYWSGSAWVNTVPSVRTASAWYRTTPNSVVSYDATGAGSATTASAASLTYTHVCGGSNRALIVALAISTGSVPNDTDWTRTATYNGVSMTSLGMISAGSADGHVQDGFLELFGLLSPATGSHSVVVSCTRSAVTPQCLVSNSVSYKGVGSFGAPVMLGPIAAPYQVTVPSAVNNMVFTGISSGADISGPTKTQRVLTNYFHGSGNGNILLQDAAGAATVTTGMANNSDWAAIIGVNLVAA